MNSEDIEKQFEKWRAAGHGSIVKIDADGSGQAIAGIIFEPSSQRPAGFESGIFVSIPSDTDHIYYLDPEASKQKGQFIMQVLEIKSQKAVLDTSPDEMLREFEYLRKASDVKRGGGAVGKANSKDKGMVNME